MTPKPKPQSRPSSVEPDKLDINRNVVKQWVEDSEKREHKKEILYSGAYYDVTSFVDRHPGGKVINYYTESQEDATIAVQQFHARSFSKVEGIMKSFRKRLPTAEESATIARHKALDGDFAKLYKELKAEGYFDPSYTHLAYRFLELILFKVLGSYILFYCDSWTSWICGLIVFQIGSSRAGWLQHEAGHYSLTGKRWLDRICHTITMSFSEGLAASWWTSQHNRHHAMPQRVHRDVDLDTLPFVAFSSESDVVGNKKDVENNALIKYQAILFLPIQSFLVSLYWKLYAHPKTAFHKRKWFDLSCMALHYIVFLPILGFPTYMLLHWIQFAYYFGSFALSHSHLPVTKDRLHWVEYALNHTTNIHPSWLSNWFMGYLNLQIEHHLFPTMPNFRHPQIMARVQELARKHNIKYNLVSYSEAIRRTFQNLSHVSDELTRSKNKGL